MCRGVPLGGAHVKHGAHCSDAGRVEAQGLVEDICTLPSRRHCIQTVRRAREARVHGRGVAAGAACVHSEFWHFERR